MGAASGNRALRQLRDDVVIEGLHALKHALRFEADVTAVLSPDPARVVELATSLCPDLLPQLVPLISQVSLTEFAALAGGAVPTGVVAHVTRVQRPIPMSIEDSDGPIVLLDRPTHHGNIGAVVRTAAAAGAAAVLTTGPHDPWHRSALRAAAGLHFALPVQRIEELPATDRPLVALDPEGAPLRIGSIPDHAILLFGSERRGLDERWKRRAERVFALPMEPGVSSLNLAASVAAVLYRWRIDREDR